MGMLGIPVFALYRLLLDAALFEGVDFGIFLVKKVIDWLCL